VADRTTTVNSYLLSQNFPNPFNPSTQIVYHILSSGPVLLQVFDVLGRNVATLVNDTQQPGRYSISFNASSLPSGLYFYQLRTGTVSETKRMMLLK
jgi:hypothetical protein